METSAFVSEKRERPPANVLVYLNASSHSRERRCRVDALRLAPVADEELVEGRA